METCFAAAENGLNAKYQFHYFVHCMVCDQIKIILCLYVQALSMLFSA